MDYQNDADNQALRREQLGAAQRTNALADLTAQQTRQAMADQQRSNALIQAAYRQADPIKALRATGDRAAIDLADKQETQALGRGKTEADTAKTNTEAAEIKRKALLQQVAALSSPQDALALIDHGENQLKTLPAPVAAALRNMVQSDPRWQLKLMLGIGDPTKMVDVLKPHLQQVNNGKVTSFVDTNSYTNPAGPAPITMTTTPGEDSSAATQRRGQDMTAGTAAAGRAQAERHFGVTQAAAAKDMIYDPDRGVLINKATGLARPAATMDGTPLGAKDKPLPEGAQKQIMGTRNLQDAVANYRSKLAEFGKIDMLSPDARAKMGNAYNNMMLQAKEAYNLGVLNGPDYDILQSVVKDPTKMGAAITSRSAMDAQASELSRIAAGIEKTAMESHGKAYKPRDVSGGPTPSTGPAKITDDAGYNALPSGATFVGPDGKTRRKP
jgi:hypothetical protein